MRLHKLIASRGAASRRGAEALMAAGRVRVNGRVADRPGTSVDPAVDEVLVDGEPLDASPAEGVYVVLNKPRGCVTTVRDPEGRPTVMDLLPPMRERVWPVGRLDFHSEGLLLLTNDGDLAHRVLHPSHGLARTYEAKVEGPVTDDVLRRLRAPLRVAGRSVRPLSARLLRRTRGGGWVGLRVGEGRNREVRRICEAAGLSVLRLRRTALGGLGLGRLPAGRFRLVRRGALLRALGRELR